MSSIYDDLRPVPDLPRPQRIFGAPDHGIPPLEEIARLMRSLTYGEMIELAKALWTAKDDTEITADTLPAILHAWATR